MQTSEKLKKCFDILNSNQNKFVKNEQIYDVEDYLKSNFDCTNIPADVLNFFTYTDGMNINFVSFYSISNQNKTIPVLTFDIYSTVTQNERFCSAYGVNKNAFLFFGEDGRMGKFAFLKNAPYSNSIFHFVGEGKYEIREYNTFADLLTQLLQENL